MALVMALQQGWDPEAIDFKGTCYHLLQASTRSGADNLNPTDLLSPLLISDVNIGSEQRHPRAY